MRGRNECGYMVKEYSGFLSLTPAQMAQVLRSGGAGQFSAKSDLIAILATDGIVEFCEGNGIASFIEYHIVHEGSH